MFSVLRPGDEMLQIVPTGDRLIVEGHVEVTLNDTRTVEIKPSGLSLVPTTTVSFAVVNEVASFTFNGVVYSFDVVPTGGTPAAIDGEAVVIDGMIVVTVDGVSYSVPAVSP